MNPTVISTIHVVGIALLFMVIVARSTTLFKGTQGNQPNPSFRKLFVAIQHTSLTLVVITGITLLAMNNFKLKLGFMQKWFCSWLCFRL